MGKGHLKIRYHKKGLCPKKDCVMNITVLHHEYKWGLHSDFFLGGWGWGTLWWWALGWVGISEGGGGGGG